MQFSNSLHEYRIVHGARLATLFVALIVTLTACGDSSSESVAQSAGSKMSSVSHQVATSDNIVINVTLKEFAFVPDTLRIPSGKKVVLVLENEGAVAHEFMAGRDVKSDITSFNEDLFAGVDVEMNMGMGNMDHDGMGNMEKMGDMDHEAMENMGNMEKMGDMDHDDMKNMEKMEDMDHDDMKNMEKMGDMDHDGMGNMEKMGDMDHEAMKNMKEEHEHAENAEEHEHAEEAEEAEEHEHGGAGHGTMMLVETNTSGTMTFTLPQSKRGTWTIGCFVPGHFQAGMKAILIVE